MEFDQKFFLHILRHIPKNSNPFKIANYSTSNSNLLNIEQTEYLSNNNILCPICLNAVSFGVRPNKCNHIFCYDCLSKWAKTKKICPYCRIKFSTILKLNMVPTFFTFQRKYSEE